MAIYDIQCKYICVYLQRNSARCVFFAMTKRTKIDLKMDKCRLEGVERGGYFAYNNKKLKRILKIAEKKKILRLCCV